MKLKSVLLSAVAVAALAAVSGVAYAQHVHCTPSQCSCSGQNGSQCCGSSSCSMDAGGNCTCT